MKQTGQNTPPKPKSRHKKKTPTENRARFLVEQCPHRIVGVVHLPGCDIEAPDAPEHESHNEHAAIRVLALCSDVAKIHSQHEKITYVDAAGKERKYTPDFGITLTDASIVPVEVKPLTILLRPDSQDKFIAIAKAYGNRLQSLVILTNHALRLEPRHTIARCLRRYWIASVPESARESILATLSKGQKAIKDVVAEVRNDSCLAHIYTLIAQRQLCISWNEPFGPSMHVSLPEAPYAPLTFADIARASRFDPLVQDLVLGRRAQDQQLLAAALAQDKSVPLSAPIGSVDGYPRRAMQVGRNFRMPGVRETGHSKSSTTRGHPSQDVNLEAGHEEV